MILQKPVLSFKCNDFFKMVNLKAISSSATLTRFIPRPPAICLGISVAYTYSIIIKDARLCTINVSAKVDYMSKSS